MNVFSQLLYQKICKMSINNETIDSFSMDFFIFRQLGEQFIPFRTSIMILGVIGVKTVFPTDSSLLSYAP